jgi:PAS domain S-box-containing protein
VKKLKDSKNSLEEIDRVCFIGLDGIVYASSNEAIIGRSAKGSDFFEKGKTEKGVYFVDDGGELKIFFSGPYVLEDKKIGVGIMVISLEEFDEIVSNRTGLRDSGEIVVAVEDKNVRTYLVERRFESAALDPNAVVEVTNAMSAALAGKETDFTKGVDYRGVNVVAVSRFIEEGRIGLVAKIDYSEAIEAPISALFWRTSIVLLFFVIAFIIVSVLVSFSLSKPIKNLTNLVDKVTHGDLEVQLGKSNIDEIQNLTDSLNRVLASMKLAILRLGLTKQDVGLGDVIKAKESAENKYKCIFDSSADAIMVLEPPLWKFTSANPATLKMFGAKSESEFTSLGPWEVSPERQPDGKKSSDEAKRHIEEAMKQGSSSFEWVHRTVFGKDFPTRVLLSRVILGDKSVLQATVRNLTDEKTAQDELRISEENFKKLFDSAPVAMYINDLKGRLVEGNKAALNLIGYKKEELFGKSVLDVQLLDKKDIPRGVKWLALNVAGKSTGPDRVTITKKGGSKVTVEMSSQPITLGGKKLVLASLYEVK